MFHVISSIKKANHWQYQTTPITGTPYSLNLLVAMKMAMMDPALHSPLADHLAAISDIPPITYRV